MDDEELERMIEKLNNRIDDLERQIKDLKNEEKGYSPVKGEEYSYVDLDTMTIEIGDWDGYVDDITRKKNRIIFDTEEKAAEYLEYLLEKRKHMNIFTEEEWKDVRIDKWYYFYDYENEIICCDYRDLIKTNVPYFKTEKEIINFIEEYEWQIKHELGVK